ncbi:unnamed protein product, partial [Iphiclides podalirius]
MRKPLLSYTCPQATKLGCPLTEPRFPPSIAQVLYEQQLYLTITRGHLSYCPLRTSGLSGTRRGHDAYYGRACRLRASALANPVAGFCTRGAAGAREK